MTTDDCEADCGRPPVGKPLTSDTSGEACKRNLLHGMGHSPEKPLHVNGTATSLYRMIPGHVKYEKTVGQESHSAAS